MADYLINANAIPQVDKIEGSKEIVDFVSSLHTVPASVLMDAAIDPDSDTASNFKVFNGWAPRWGTYYKVSDLENIDKATKMLRSNRYYFSTVENDEVTYVAPLSKDSWRMLYSLCK